MKVRLYGTRGSLAAPGPDTLRYGGNTSCVQLTGREQTTLILDAGTGIRLAGLDMTGEPRRVDVLLTHLHMDHIQGLGFFAPLRQPGWQVHIWGPASTTLDLRTRLSRYLSPPTFPVQLRELASEIHLHEVPQAEFEIGEFRIATMLVCHPNPTVGYRITTPEAVMTYLPDHEPALGARQFPMPGKWTSGYDLAEGADLLIHDAQYDNGEYHERVGFGHSTIVQAMQFAALTQVARLAPFHHDPAHSDDELDRLTAEAMNEVGPSFAVLPGKEGSVFDLGAATSRPSG